MCDFDIIFDIYNKSVDITNDEKIKHMPQLLGHFYNYLNSIILVYSDEISRKEIENRKTKLITNINIIIDFYSPIDIKIKEINFQINYLLIDLMTLAIIILYSYIYVIKNIKTVSLQTIIKKTITKGKKHYTITELLPKTEGETDIIANDKFLRKMIIEILNKIDKNYEEKEIYDILKYKIYRIDITQSLLYEEINTIINKFKIIYNIKPTEIITIAQYEGICWFTAFLTCICYSDANRKIFYDKVYQKAIEIIEKVYTNYKLILDDLIKDNIDYRELIIVKYIINPSIYITGLGTITTANPYKYSGNELFILFVYIIIKYISNERKKYTDYKADILNIIYEIIKKYPINILYNLYIEYKQNQYDNSDYKFFNYLLNKNHQPTQKNDLDHFFGMRKIHSNFLNIFYKKLDINILFLFLIEKKYYIISDNSIKDEPEIILIQKVYDYDYDSDLIEYIMVHKLDLNYELDYILFLSDENTSTGHAICTITYNNEEYYYDSRYDTLEENKLFFLDTFYKPCPLIKQKWKNKNIGKFCLKECFYTKLNEKSKISRIIKNSTDNMCYNYENNYITCYVKKQPKLEGGTNEKLISTNTKINILIDNKKIQRTVYINNDGIKVIKYNNKLIKIYNK